MVRHGDVCLFFDVDKSLWGDAFSNEVAELIPEEVRDDLLPGQMMIACGFHDLFDPSEREEGVFVGRAFLHVGFFGYGLPTLWPETRQAMKSLPVAATIRETLQEICGAPFDVTAMWYV